MCFQLTALAARSVVSMPDAAAVIRFLGKAL
jgi:hypothetical protein